VLDARSRPLQDVQILVQRDTNFHYRIDRKNFFETGTDSNGRFHLTSLSSGEYSVSVTRIKEVDDLIVSHIKARASELTKPHRGNTGAEVTVHPNYIPFNVSLNCDEKHTIATTVTYCPKCEDAVWLIEEFRRDLGYVPGKEDSERH